jgi:hypothetical protein
VDEGDALLGCVPFPATDTNGDGVKDTFVNAGGDVPLCFEIELAATTGLVAGPEAKFYAAQLAFVGKPRGAVFDTRVVLFVVPPKDL